QGVRPEGPVYVKVAFSIVDLVAWKQAAGPYRENPEVSRILDTIIRTQVPDWNDMQVIMDYLMDGTEKQMVLRAAKAQAETAVLNGTARGSLEQNFPSRDLECDPNHVEHRQRLNHYRNWVVYGVKHVIPKAVNWSKLYEVRQDKNESPSVFL
ncbi:hypothetical protein M959_02403, partial [Chaetura pelagica]